MKPIGHKIEEKITRKPLNNSEETWTKYGIEQKIHDFIQEGREGTEATKIVEKAQGLNNLPHVKEIMADTGEKVALDMNIDPFTANTLIKMGNIAEKKLLEKKRLAEIEAKRLAEEEALKQKQSKGENVND